MVSLSNHERAALRQAQGQLHTSHQSKLVELLVPSPKMGIFQAVSYIGNHQLILLQIVDNPIFSLLKNAQNSGRRRKRPFPRIVRG